MPASMATKLGIQFARFAQYTAASAASNNAGTHGLRNAFANASSGSTWAPGLSGSTGSASANGTSLGGEKFHAGRGAHSSFQQSGRALTNANASSATDGNGPLNDEEDDKAASSAHGAAGIHRSVFREGRNSILQHALRRRLNETTSTVHLIMPSSASKGVLSVRSLSTSRPTESPQVAASERPKADDLDKSQSSSLGRARSVSTSASLSQEASFATESIPSSSVDDSVLVGASRRVRGSNRIGERLEGKVLDALTALSSAMRTQDPQAILSQVDIFRSSGKEVHSTAGFNLAMQMMSGMTAPHCTDDVLALYEQMLQSDCVPNVKTYQTIVKTLCQRDFEQQPLATSDLLFRSDVRAQQESLDKPTSRSARSDGDYHQSLALLDLVHSSTNGFFEAKPYNLILRSCALRGDAETACLVIDRLSANKMVMPDAFTFLRLIQSFGRDENIHPDETRSQFNARKLAACEQVFHEFEVFRNTEGWEDNNNTNDVLVWNVMITCYLSMDQAPKAFELLEQMIGSKEVESGKRAAPAATSKTSRSIIMHFVEMGDTEGAIDWLSRLFALRESTAKTDVPVMPLPAEEVLVGLVLNFLSSALFAGETLTPQADLATQLKTLKIVNQVLSYICKDTARKSRDGWATTVLWRRYTSASANVATVLIKQGKTLEAETLCDASLSSIQAFFDVYADRLTWSRVLDNHVVLTKAYVQHMDDNAIAIGELIVPLLSLQRYADAASAFSYMAAALGSIKTRHKDLKHLQELLDDAALPILGFSKTSKEQIKGATSLDTKLLLHLALRSLVPTGERLVSPSPALKKAICTLYLQAREQSGGLHALELDTRDLNHLIDAFLNRTDFAPDASAFKLIFSDLAELPERAREELNVRRAADVLPLVMSTEESVTLMRLIRSDFVGISGKNSAGFQPELASSNSLTNMARPTSDGTDMQSLADTNTSIASPESSEKSFDHISASTYGIDMTYSLPTVTSIDAGLGTHLVLQVKRSYDRRNKGIRESEDFLNKLYETLIVPIHDSGTYPTLNGICSLLMQFGRRGDLDRTKELYVIGSHVIASVQDDVAWQQQAWFELEDAMIAALAHGGDPRLASEHRHKLLSNGYVPSADTYAALITVIRDSTDEALIAEELFDESQRLGVRPTAYLYNTVLSKLSRARKAERALQLFDEMINRRVQPSSITYGAILNACTRTGDEANAERFFSMMEGDVLFRPKAPPYNTIIQFYTQTKPNRTKALHYYGKMRARDVAPTAHTYKLLLDVYGNVAPINLEGLTKAFGQLIADPRIEVQGNHWASLITAHGIQCNNLGKAMEIYGSIPNHVATVRSGRKGLAPDALSFEALLTVFAEHQRIDLMEQYIEDRKAAGCALTAYVANILIKSSANLIPGPDGLSRARSIFEEMQDPPIGIAAAGNHPLQRQHVSGVQHETDSSANVSGFGAVLREPSTFETMVRAEVEHGNHSEAASLIQRMQQRGYPPVVVARAQEALASSPTYTSPADSSADSPASN